MNRIRGAGTHGEGASVIFDSELQASFRGVGHLARCGYVVEVDHPSHQRYATWAGDQVANVSLGVRGAWLPFVQWWVESGLDLGGGEAVARVRRFMVRCSLLRFLSSGYFWLEERLDGCHLRCH